MGRVFDNESRQKELVTQPYDIVEIALLAAISLDVLVKLAFTTKHSRRVS